MAKKTIDKAEHKNPVLTKSQEEVSTWLKKRISIGVEILSKDIRSGSDLEIVYKEEEKWRKFNKEYLKHCFDTNVISEEYGFAGATGLYINPSLNQEIQSFKESVQRQVNELESIDERLSIYDEKISSDKLKPNSFNSKKVFIVHGHDQALKHKVARFIEKLGLEAVILDEQVNAGMTIIEKFEAHAQDTGYAIVLLTHDDMGYPKDFPDQVRPRARQNAIGELYYFMKALGRKNITILCSEEIELPSDLHGIVYVSSSEWELKLAKEMKAAGLDIDLNKL